MLIFYRKVNIFLHRKLLSDLIVFLCSSSTICVMHVKTSESGVCLRSGLFGLKFYGKPLNLWWWTNKNQWRTHCVFHFCLVYQVKRQFVVSSTVKYRCMSTIICASACFITGELSPISCEKSTNWENLAKRQQENPLECYCSTVVCE